MQGPLACLELEHVAPPVVFWETWRSRLAGCDRLGLGSRGPIVRGVRLYEFENALPLAPRTSDARKLADDRGGGCLASGDLGLQLPREGFGAGKNFPPAGSFKCLRRPLTGLLARPVPCDRLTPFASHGRCAGRRGTMPCAWRQRSERRRLSRDRARLDLPELQTWFCVQDASRGGLQPSLSRFTTVNLTVEKGEFV
jgi:hypothetical protein